MTDAEEINRLQKRIAQLRKEKWKIKQAFRRYVDRHFVQVCIKRSQENRK